MTIREAARQVGGHEGGARDVHALLDAGVLERTEDGPLLLPYDAVHVNFVLEAV